MSDLRVTFATRRGPVRAVDGVDLVVGPGEIVGIVGESGSGKSVTLRAIMRLLRQATVTGRVGWQGRDLLALPERELRAIRGRQIAMIFQEPMTALNPVLTIGEQIGEALAAHGRQDKVSAHGRQGKVSAHGRQDRAEALLDMVGIGSPRQRLASYPHEFSGGMRQRAMIAIALAAEPRLLLADEPTTALDVTIQDQILQLLMRLSDELGLAMVLVTHDLGVVAETCGRVCVMYAGRIVETAAVGDLFARPRHGYTHALLGAVPHGRARQPLTAIPGQPPQLDRPISGCPFAPRCAFAEARCAVLAPPMAEVAPGHHAACWAADRIGAA